MESKDNIFNNSFKDNTISFNNDSINLNFISKKIKYIKINQQELNNFCIQSKKENGNDFAAEKELGNKIKVVDFLTNDIINKMNLLNQTTKETVSMKNLKQKKVEFFDKNKREFIY